MIESILITGGSGSFGSAFARMLLEEPVRLSRIVLYSRGEHRQFQLAQELGPNDASNQLRFMIGDVRDRKRLERAMKGVGIVIHAAALKRIETGHYNPIEMVRTNIDGSINVIEAAQDAGVRKVVFLSSDKAYQPISPYGQSKALAESLFLAANNISGWHGPKFSVTRYGNVWCSAGSVVPKWREMIAAGATHVQVTDPDCTRFFMRMSEAVSLVMDTMLSPEGGELRIPKLPAYRLGDLAEAMGVKTKVIGLPKWEKLHESMEAGNSSDLARRMSIDELKEALAKSGY